MFIFNEPLWIRGPVENNGCKSKPSVISVGMPTDGLFMNIALRMDKRQLKIYASNLICMQLIKLHQFSRNNEMIAFQDDMI